MILWTASFSSNLFSVFWNPCTVFAKQTKSDENIAFHLVRITENTWSENKSEKDRMYYMYGQWMENKDSKNTLLSRDIRKYLRMNSMGYLRWLVFGMRFFNTRTHSGLFIYTTKNLRRCSKFILSKTDLSYF